MCIRDRLPDDVCDAASREQAENTAYVKQMKRASRDEPDDNKKQELPLQHVVSAELYDLSSTLSTELGECRASSRCQSLLNTIWLTGDVWCADTCQESSPPQ